MLEALIAVIAVPSPLKDAAETTFDMNDPLASRKTIVLALLAVSPVVRALAMVPLVMFEALIAVKVAPLPEIFVKLPVVALTVVKVPTLAANDPLVSRDTIVFAPLHHHHLVYQHC